MKAAITNLVNLISDILILIWRLIKKFPIYSILIAIIIILLVLYYKLNKEYQLLSKTSSLKIQNTIVKYDSILYANITKRAKQIEEQNNQLLKLLKEKEQTILYQAEIIAQYNNKIDSIKTIQPDSSILARYKNITDKDRYFEVTTSDSLFISGHFNVSEPYMLYIHQWHLPLALKIYITYDKNDNIYTYVQTNNKNITITDLSSIINTKQKPNFNIYFGSTIYNQFLFKPYGISFFLGTQIVQINNFKYADFIGLHGGFTYINGQSFYNIGFIITK